MYNGPGNRLTRVQDAEGYQTAIAYDANSQRVSSVTNPDAQDRIWHVTPFLADGLSEKEIRLAAAGGIGEHDAPAGQLKESRAIYTDPKALVWTYQTNHYGHITAVANPSPFEDVWKWERNQHGLVVKHIEPAGGGGTLDFANELTTEYFYDGKVSHTEPLSAGNLTKIVYAQDKEEGGGKITESWTYDANTSQITSYTDGRDNTTTYTLDARGNIDLIVMPEGVQVDFLSYTAAPTLLSSLQGGLIREVKNPRGYITETLYYTSGILVGLVEETIAAKGTADESRVTYEYDSNGNPSAVVQDMLVDRRTEYEYDELDRLVAVTQYLSDEFVPASRAITTLFGYDDRSRLIITTDALGRITEYEYDGMGRLEKEILPEAPQYIVGSIQNKTPIAQYFYDANGNLEKSTRGSSVGPGVVNYKYDERNLVKEETHSSDELLKVLFEYDSLGNLKKVTAPDGGVTESEYDNLHRLTKETMPDPGTGDHGRPVTTFDYDDAGNREVVASHNRYTVYEYDDLNRLRFESRKKTEGGAVLAKTEWQYDENGNIEKIIDPEQQVGGDFAGKFTEFVYDALDRQTQVIQPAALHASGLTQTPVTQFSYNEAGEVESVTDPLGNVTTYKYDTLGRQTSVTQAQVKDWDNSAALTHPVSYFQYDEVGNLRFVVDAEGNTVEYVYDDLDRLTRTIQPEITSTVLVGTTVTTTLVQPTIEYQYDEYGQRRVVIDANGNETSYTYDKLGQLWRISQPYTDDHGVVWTTFEYDVAGRQEKVTSPNANGGYRETITYYDDLGRVKTIVDPSGSKSVNFYNLDGTIQRTEQQNSGGTVLAKSAFGYDDLLRRETVTVTTDIANNTTETTTYVYDAVGNLKSLTDSANNTTSYDYDSLYRLISETITLEGGTESRHFDYDKNGNLRYRDDRNNRTIEYQYDALNRQEKELWTGSGANGYVADYHYDLAGHLIHASDDVSSSDHSTLDFVLDAAYRTIGVSQQLPGVNANGDYDSTLTYGYDANGNRTRTQVDVDATLDHQNLYVYDALNRAISIQQQGPSGGTVSFKLARYEYNADGSVRSIERKDSGPGSGSAFLVGTSHYSYQNNGLIANLTHKDSAGTAQVVYGWIYNAQNLISKYEAERPIVDVNGQFNVDDDMEYDALGQLVAVNGVPRNGASAEEDAYGANGNRNGVANANGDASVYVTEKDNRLKEDPHYTYTYDAEGNRTSRTLKESFVQALDINSTGDSGNIAIRDAEVGSDDWITIDQGRGGNQIAYRVPDDPNAPANEHASVSWIFRDLAPGEYRIFATWNPAGAELEALTGWTDTAANTAFFSVSDGNNLLGLAEENLQLAPDDTTAYDATWEKLYYNGDSSDDTVIIAPNSSGQIVITLSTQGAQDSGGIFNRYILADSVLVERVGSAGYGEKTTYQWDHRNLLTRIETFTDKDDVQAAEAINYVYDALGRRVAKEFDQGANSTVETVENYVLDGQHVALERQNESNGSSHQYRMLWANSVDQLLAIEEQFDSDAPKVPAWVLPDHQGTIRDYIASRDAELYHSKLFRTMNYTAVGWQAGSELWVANISTDFTNAVSNIAGSFTFGNAGQKFDAESGLQYSRARYHDGFSSGFISQDPLGFLAGDNNLYRRVGNSPQNATDPSGELIWFIPLGILALGLGGIGYYAGQAEYYSHLNGGEGGGGLEALSAAGQGARGGGSILTNTFTFGGSDYAGLTNSTQYQGGAYDVSRVAAVVARESLITAATLGVGNALRAGSLALRASSAGNAARASGIVATLRSPIARMAAQVAGRSPLGLNSLRAANIGLLGYEAIQTGQSAHASYAAFRRGDIAGGVFNLGLTALGGLGIRGGLKGLGGRSWFAKAPNIGLGPVSRRGVLNLGGDILSSRHGFRIRGAQRLDGLREATHADVMRAFVTSQFKPTSHFVKRLKAVRTDALGVRTFKDLETIFRKGSLFDADDGLKAIVHNSMAIIVNPRTGRLVTLTPWK